MKSSTFTLLAALLLVSCSGSGSTSGEVRAPTPPPTAVAQGVVESETGLVRVLSPREGVLERVSVLEGDRVARGQSLAQMQDLQARLELAVSAAELSDRRAQTGIAEAKVQAASRDARRLGRLAKADAATRQDAEQAATAATVAVGERLQAQAALRVAAARRELGAYEVEVRNIRAKVAGRVVRRVAAPGAFVAAASPLFIIEPDGRRVIRAELDEAFADRVKPGMIAIVSREFQQGRTYRARVLRVADVLAGPVLGDETALRADSRVVTVVLGLPDQTNFRIGQRVLVRFQP